MSDKPRQHQLKILTSARSTVEASLTVWIFLFVFIYLFTLFNVGLQNS